MGKKPTDTEIMAALTERWKGGAMTYVIRNVLASKYPKIKTDFVRRRLVKMEGEGKVRRIPTMYVSQICWAMPDKDDT